jgi:hypothetical protein
MFFIPTLKNGFVTVPATTSSITTPPVSGYVLWLAPESSIYQDRNAVTASTNGSIVKYWQDLSGFGNHAIHTASNGPPSDVICTGSLNGQRILKFGQDQNAAFGQRQRTGLLTPQVDLGSDGVTVFFVASFLNPPDPEIAEIYGAFFGYHNFDYLVRKNNTAWQVVTYNNASGVAITDPVDVGSSSFQAWSWRFDASLNEQRLWRSGSSVVSGTDNGNTASLGKIAVGYREDDAVNSHMCGYMAEMIVYQGGLSDSDVGLVNAYLQNKYNV